MNHAATQFVVAVVAVMFLGIATLLAIGAQLFNDGDSNITFLLIGALTSVTSMSAAYLFRLNGNGAPPKSAQGVQNGTG
jgi:hypothetical protein